MSPTPLPEREIPAAHPLLAPFAQLQLRNRALCQAGGAQRWAAAAAAVRSSAARWPTQRPRAHRAGARSCLRWFPCRATPPAAGARHACASTSRRTSKTSRLPPEPAAAQHDTMTFPGTWMWPSTRNFSQI